MIRCPYCKTRLSIESGDQSTTKVDENAYRICWVARVNVNCPQCGKVIQGTSLEGILPDEFILAEGAKLMRKRNPHRLNPKSGSAAANIRWAKKREREAWESFNKGILTRLKLNELLEEIGIPPDKRVQPPTKK